MVADQIPTLERLLTFFFSLFALFHLFAQLLLSFSGCIFQVFLRICVVQVFSVLSLLPVSFNTYSIFNRNIDFARNNEPFLKLSVSHWCLKTRPYSKSLTFSYPNNSDTTLWSITDHKRPYLFTYSHDRPSTTPSETFSPSVTPCSL